MKHNTGIAVAWKPRFQTDSDYTSHVGIVIYHTTDNFYQVQWGEENPNPRFFNTEHVFRYEELVELAHHRKVCTCGKQIANCRCMDRSGTKPTIIIKSGCKGCRKPNPWKA